MSDEGITALENALQEGLNQDHGEVNLTGDTNDAPEVPAQYADKSQADLVKMLTDAQAMIGRQSAEVGEMRRFTEQLMARENERIESSEVHQTVQWNDDNPLESISNVVESTVTQKMKALEEQIAKLTQYTAKQELQDAHADWQDIVYSDGFRNYAISSPIKQELYNRANQGDVQAADELLQSYKSIMQANSAPQSSVDPVGQAELETPNPVITRTQAGKPVLRRVDIVKLQTENPKRYKELLPEIRQAYLDKRVV